MQTSPAKLVNVLPISAAEIVLTDVPHFDYRREVFPKQAVLWILVALILSTSCLSQGAGITIVTHGFEFNNEYPFWLDDMGAAIAARAGPSAAIIKAEVGYLQDG